MTTQSQPNPTQPTVLEIYSEQQKLAEFEARVERGEKVEPGDWMPEAYRRDHSFPGASYSTSTQNYYQENVLNSLSHFIPSGPRKRMHSLLG